jgi:signal transduction histidine kinase
LKVLNDKLNTSEHALLKLNASKDKFFAIISHDLRNPLAAFKNIAKQLLNSKGNLDNEQLADYISDIKVSADQLSELTENLLRWAQSQADLIEMKEAEIDLGIVASKFLLTNETQAKQAGIDLSSEIPENLYVRADLNMLNTVFRNIIGNALKFTPAGGKVSISAEVNEAELVVRISDTGIGIAEKDVEKMFHIEKDHKTIGNSKNKGSGLGLILCKEFVERNGGRIWVESKLGKGTTFYFTLKKAKS